jgi:branched-chain amino acid aminotransferase
VTAVGSHPVEHAENDEGIAIVDGQLCRPADGTIPITDEGLLRGDGAFEVIRLYFGRAFALDEHLDRLARSARALRLPYDAQSLARELAVLIGAAGVRDAAVRVVVTRAGRRIAIVESLPLMAPTIALATVEYQPIGVMRGVKSLSYAPNMLVRRVAIARGADDALFVTPAGEVLEAPTAAFFYVRNGQLFTPPLAAGILDSITRRHLLAVTDCAERTTTRDELSEIEEAFLGSTLREVHPVRAIDGRMLAPAPGPKTLDTETAIQAHIENALGPSP